MRLLCGVKECCPVLAVHCFSNLELLQVPLCYIQENVTKMMGDWLAQRPVEALSKFMLWLLKEVLEDSQSQQSGSHKGPKAVPQPSGKTKVSLMHLFKFHSPSVILLCTFG
jgi:hypothetical protein